MRKGKSKSVQRLLKTNYPRRPSFFFSKECQQLTFASQIVAVAVVVVVVVMGVCSSVDKEVQR